MISQLKQELRIAFGNPTAYVAILAFVLVNALFLWFFENDFNVFLNENASLTSFFFVAPWILVFLSPALSMRLLAQEEQTGTLQWLFTQPIRIRNLVLGKYISVLLILLFALLLSLIFPWSLNLVSDPNLPPDWNVIFNGYLGLFLLCACFSAVGLFGSSLTANPVVAYLIGVLLNFVLFYGFEALGSYSLFGSYDFWIQRLSLQTHLNSFLRGILDSRSLLFFLLLVGVLLYASIQIIQKKKNA